MKRIALALATALLMAPQPVPAKKPTKLEDMEYLRARKIILRSGWVPVLGECRGPDVNDHTCATYPEVGNCTGVGIGYCDMTFRRGEQCLYLVTIGGAPQDKPGDTEVRDVRFSRGQCVKNR
jgi:hypothetical protein